MLPRLLVSIDRKGSVQSAKENVDLAIGETQRVAKNNTARIEATS